jgi:hypothetical protein
MARTRNNILSDLKSRGCAENGCWELTEFVDGGVTVRLGAGWECFMADRHFSNRRRCLPRRLGEFCDGIAAFGQPSNSRVRIIEAKATPDFAAAKPQLRKGLVFALSLPSVKREQVSLEVHTRPAARITVRPSAAARSLQLGSARFPIEWIANGASQF